METISINFVDEDGEVLQLQTTSSEKILSLFDRYSSHHNIPFILGRLLFDFRYNGKLISNLYGAENSVGGMGIVASELR